MNGLDVVDASTGTMMVGRHRKEWFGTYNATFASIKVIND